MCVMCELTLLVTSITVVIFYQGWRNPEWTVLTCIYIRSKLGSYHALFRDMSHSRTDVCMVDWFSNMYVPWITALRDY